MKGTITKPLAPVEVAAWRLRAHDARRRVLLVRAVVSAACGCDSGARLALDLQGISSKARESTAGIQWLGPRQQRLQHYPCAPHDDDVLISMFYPLTNASLLLRRCVLADHHSVQPLVVIPQTPEALAPGRLILLLHPWRSPGASLCFLSGCMLRHRLTRLKTRRVLLEPLAIECTPCAGRPTWYGLWPVARTTTFMFSNSVRRRSRYVCPGTRACVLEPWQAELRLQGMATHY
jgi:hypothetical protein